MHRWKLWWVIMGLSAAATTAGCQAGSGPGIASTSSSDIASSVSKNVGSSSKAAAASTDRFSCPSVNDINALTALLLKTAPGNTGNNCRYVAAGGTSSDIRITIEHPPTAANPAGRTLADFRNSYTGKQVAVRTATQFSTQAFIARSSDHSCAVFALARDGQVMAVQASHQSAPQVDDCSLAQSVTVVAGTGQRSEIPAAVSTMTTTGGTSRPTDQPQGTPAVGTTPEVTPTPEVTTTATGTPTPAMPSRAPSPTAHPTDPPSETEVLIFSTGPAASLTLPAP